MFLISFLGVMIGVLGLMLTWKWGKRKFAEYKQVEGDIGQLDYPDYVELLLRKYNRKFKVIADCGDLGGICDYGKKEIRLTYKPGTKKFEAFWEAAHEVGHAVWGQPALRKPIVIVPIFLAMTTFTIVGAIYGYGKILVLDWLMIFTVFLARWFDEVKASAFAALELSRLIKPGLLKRRLSFERVYLALESFSMALTLSMAFNVLYYSLKITLH